jgi:RNA polymerase sigma-70 factor (ECF subfamily)
MELMDLLDRNLELGLECMIEQYSGLVYSIIYSKVSTVGTEEDINECVSDVFMEFFLKKESMDQSKGSVKGYLAVIAKHKGIDLYRKLFRTAGQSTDIKENWEFFEDTRVNLEQSVIAREEKSLLLGALDTLGEPDKEIIIRKYYFGQKTKEIAGLLNLRENTVDKKISRGLKKLRIILGGVDNGRENKIYAK